MIPTACLSRVKQYEAAKDRYFHLAASSVPLPFVLPVVLFLSSSFILPTSFPTSGRLVGREVRPVRLERGILGVEVDQSAGCHPPTHLFDPFLQPRREDSVARTVQPASPVSSDERGEGQFRWKPQGFCWEYSSGVALTHFALESRAGVPQVGTPWWVGSPGAEP